MHMPLDIDTITRGDVTYYRVDQGWVAKNPGYQMVIDHLSWTGAATARLPASWNLYDNDFRYVGPATDAPFGETP